jgi:hypothetical protein
MMKRITLAATVALCFAIPAVHAADPAPVTVAPPKCDPKPEYPGRLAMQSDNRANAFRKELDVYKTCMSDYLTVRKATIKANEDASNGAISDYNAVMKKINDAQTAAKDD